MLKTLEYYSEDGTHVIFDKYAIDSTGVVRNTKTGRIISVHKSDKYNICNVYVSEKKQHIYIGRAIASTFLGPPPSPAHTADHKDKNPDNDTLNNIRWLCKTGQRYNQNRPETLKSAFVIIRYGDERSAKEWVVILKDKKNSFGHEYTKKMIQKYARNKQDGFSYKEYPDLSEEVWKEISDSKNTQGRWEISNMCRVKYITKYAENVLYGNRLGLDNGYPTITVNGKILKCHILSFMTFFPEEYINKKPEEIILHEDDDKLDFRPHKLRIGTRSENISDAHSNGKYDGTKTARMSCVSHINGVFEKEHDNQHDAMRYLKSKGYAKASDGNICKALNGTRKSAYGRVWTLV